MSPFRMPRSRPSRSRPVVARPVLAGLAVAVVAVLATAVPASAHDRLVSSDPEPDQRLREAPTTVSLTFSADVLDMGAAVVVSDTAGTDWVSDTPTVDGPTVTAVLAADMPAAGYEIRWRVVSSDGHPITGVVPFTVGDGEPVDGAAETGAPVAGGAAQGSTEAQAAQEDEGPGRAVLVGAGGAAVAVALFVLVQLLRRRRSAAGADEAPEGPSETL